MGYVVKTKLANKSNYGGKRSADVIKYIVIHYTANDGDTDENNGKYFANNIVKASAHYFVDDDSVTQSVPDNYIAYSVGGSKYPNCSETGGGKYYGKCINTNSISIEICDDVKDGKVYPSAKTVEIAIALTKTLMKKYGIPVSNVIRHFDVNGKSCPAYWCGTSARDEKWHSEFLDKLTEANPKTKEETSKNTLTALKNQVLIMNWQKAAIKDGFKFPNYGADGKWGNECIEVAKKAVCKKRLTYKYKNLTKIVQDAVGVDVDGKFGKDTKNAVIKFQKLVGLVADGEVGINTWKKILGVK